MLLVRVSENVNVVSDEPLSWGVSVVSVTLPAALGETRMLVVMVAVAPLEVTPCTSICCVLAAASAGIVTLSVILIGVVPSDSDAIDGEAAATQDRRPAVGHLADGQGDAAGRVGRDRDVEARVRARRDRDRGKRRRDGER